MSKTQIFYNADGNAKFSIVESNLPVFHKRKHTFAMKPSSLTLMYLLKG